MYQSTKNNTKKGIIFFTHISSRNYRDYIIFGYTYFTNSFYNKLTIIEPIVYFYLLTLHVATSIRLSIFIFVQCPGTSTCYFSNDTNCFELTNGNNGCRINPVVFTLALGTNYRRVTRENLFIQGYIRNSIKYAGSGLDSLLFDCIANILFFGFIDLTEGYLLLLALVVFSSDTTPHFIIPKKW